jgi:hypothetical protein
MPRRLTVVLLLLAVAAFGSGALRYVHELEHVDRAAHERDDDGHHEHDDGSNCFVHAKLNLPMLGGGYAPVFMCVGTFVATFPTPPVPVLSRRPVLLLDSRGPPVG